MNIQNDQRLHSQFFRWFYVRNKNVGSTPRVCFCEQWEFLELLNKWVYETKILKVHKWAERPWPHFHILPRVFLLRLHPPPPLPLFRLSCLFPSPLFFTLPSSPPFLASLISDSSFRASCCFEGWERKAYGSGPGQDLCSSWTGSMRPLYRQEKVLHPFFTMYIRISMYIFYAF